MTITLFHHSSKINFMRLPSEAVLRIVGALNGVQLAELRKVSKKVNNFITKHENYLYERCLMSEYPREHVRHTIPEIPRIDWKYVYIVVDQHKVTLKRGRKYRKVIDYHDIFKMLDKILGVVELAFALVGGVMNITKVAVLGFSDTRGLVNSWLAANPNASRQDAQIAIHLIKTRPQANFNT